MKKPVKTYLLFLSLLFFHPVSAQTPDSEIIRSDYYCQIIKDRLVIKETSCVQINKRMGDKNAQILIPYSKKEKLKIHYAQIEDLSGNIIRKLKKNEINDQSAVSNATLYSDEYIKWFELKHNNYPYRVVYSYEIEKPQFISILQLNYAHRMQPVRNERITVETTAGNPIKYFQKNVDDPQIENTKNGISYTWNLSYDPPKTKEINADYNKASAPLLIVEPSNFKFGVEGNWDSWQSFGNWIYRLNEGRDILPVAEKAKVDDLLQGIEDTREKVKILYYYLQDYTRYMNVKINLGGLQTYPATYVCENRYGDCKALSNYMTAMLKHAGIDSHYTLIYSDDKVEDIPENFPYNAFNHVIVTVPTKKDTIYLECTAKNIAFAYVPKNDQGRKALIIDKDRSRLIDIPAMQADDILSVRRFNIDMRNQSESNVKLESILRGYSYELFAEIKNGLNKNIADGFIRNNILSGSYEINHYEFKDMNRDSVTITMEADIKMRNLAKKYGKNYSLAPFPWYIPPYESPEKRTQAVQISYPQNKEDIILYKFSDETINKVPEDYSIESSFGRYSIKYRINNTNELEVIKKLVIYAGRYAKDQYEAFYAFMLAINNNENKNQYIETL